MKAPGKGEHNGPLLKYLWMAKQNSTLQAPSLPNINVSIESRDLPHKKNPCLLASDITVSPILTTHRWRHHLTNGITAVFITHLVEVREERPGLHFAKVASRHKKQKAMVPPKFQSDTWLMTCVSPWNCGQLAVRERRASTRSEHHTLRCVFFKTLIEGAWREDGEPEPLHQHRDRGWRTLWSIIRQNGDHASWASRISKISSRWTRKMGQQWSRKERQSELRPRAKLRSCRRTQKERNCEKKWRSGSCSVEGGLMDRGGMNKHCHVTSCFSQSSVCSSSFLTYISIHSIITCISIHSTITCTLTHLGTFGMEETENS